MTLFEWVDRPEPPVLREFLTAVAAVDGRPSLADDGSLPGEFQRGDHLLATDDDTLVGYVHLDPDGDAFGRQVAELLVRPANRGAGIGGELVARLLDRMGLGPDVEQGDTLRVWAHGDQPAAAALADRFGFRRARELRRLRMPLPPQLPPARLPEGIRLRSFVPGSDEPAVIEVNRLAFAWHPEQGRLTEADLVDEEGESWFDPAGFLLAERESDGQVVGFHWTKVHANVGGEPTGEVYVVGVHPKAQGGGLGKALTVAGLEYLRDVRGMRRVMLYVESDNGPALAVYGRLGFTVWDTDVQYAR